MFTYYELGPVGKNDVVFAKAFLGSPRGGDHQNGLTAQSEKEDWAIALREGLEGTVEGGLE